MKRKNLLVGFLLIGLLLMSVACKDIAPNIAPSTEKKTLIVSANETVVLVPAEKAVVLVPLVDAVPGVPEVVFIGITSVSPSDFAEYQRLGNDVIVTFDEAMDPASVNLNTFIIKGSDNVKLKGIITSDDSKKIWTFNPTDYFNPNSVYDLVITTGAKGVSGNSLIKNYLWSFTSTKTGGSPDGGSDSSSSSTPAPAVPVLTTINLSQTSLNLSVNSTRQLTVTTLDQFGTHINTTLVYVSSNLSVATVNDSGLVTAVAGGATTITATSGEISGTSVINVGLPENPTAPTLGESGRFVILASQKVTTAGSIGVSNGDIGIEDQARSYYEGFTPGFFPGQFVGLTNGLSYAHDDTNPALIPAGYASTIAFLDQVRTDLGNAYTFLAADPNPSAPTQASPTELGGLTLTRGVYKTSAAVTIITGDLTLDAQGDPDSVWVFSIDGTLTTGDPGGDIILVNGAQAKNVFWRVAGVTTLGSVTNFKGNVFGWQQVNLLNGASVTGRLFSVNEQVTLIANPITKLD